MNAGIEAALRRLTPPGFFALWFGGCRFEGAEEELQAGADPEQLGAIVSALKERGYRVAIDDFGARHSNFDRLWGLTPDIVKIDRELLLQADTNPRVRKVLPKVVEIIHDLDAIVVCEGIEAVSQHQLALDAGVDLVQGFLFAKPRRDLQDLSI